MSPMPQQTPGVSKQNYRTPKAFVRAVKQRFKINRFSHDFAADSENTLAKTYFDEEMNAFGFSHWEDFCRDGWGWLNPPFANIGDWAARCVQTSDAGGNVLLLVPAGVGANWFRDYVHEKAQVLFLNDRLCFIEDWAMTIDPASVKRGNPQFYSSPPLYPKDCLLAVYGPNVTPGYRVWNWK